MNFAQLPPEAVARALGRIERQEPMQGRVAVARDKLNKMTMFDPYEKMRLEMLLELTDENSPFARSSPEEQDRLDARWKERMRAEENSHWNDGGGTPWGLIARWLGGAR